MQSGYVDLKLKRLSFVGWTLIALSFAAAGFMFLWVQREAPPMLAARSLADPNLRAPADSSPPAEPALPQALTLLFDFDRAVLLPAATRTLERLADEVKAKPGARVQAIGYADRIGSDTYNMALSQRRAEAVKSYLAGRGVSLDVLEVSAQGERAPVTGNSCAQDALETSMQDLIECLQPDRRVVLSGIEPH